MAAFDPFKGVVGTADPVQRRNQMLAQLLASNQPAPATTPLGVVNHAANGLLQGLLVNKIAGDEEAKGQVMAQALKAAQPWINPDTGKAAPGTGGMDAMLSVLAGNESTAPLALQFQTQKALKQAELDAKANEPYTLGKGQKRFVANKEVAEGAPDLPTGMVPGPDGKPVYDPAYLEGQKAIRAAGKTDVTVNTGRTLAASVAEGVAKNLTDQQKQAIAASQLIPQLNEARGILDRGGVFTGTGANIRLNLARALNTTGATDDERVANTEAYIRSTAQQVASLAKQVGGTQVSDSDRKFAERLAGGDIEWSEPGLKRLLDIGDRASRALIKDYNTRAGKMAKLPGGKEMDGLLMVDEPPAYTPPAPPQAAPTRADLEAEMRRRGLMK